jgi:hypothetical protein
MQLSVFFRHTSLDPKLQTSTSNLHHRRVPQGLQGAFQPRNLQGNLTYKKAHPPATQPKGPRGVLGGLAFSYGRDALVKDFTCLGS